MHKPVVREAVEYHVRGAAELEKAKAMREQAERAAAQKAVQEAVAAQARAAIAKPACPVNFDEWALLRLAGGEQLVSA